MSFDPDDYRQMIEDAETPAMIKSFREACAEIIKCPTCNQQFVPDDEPLCPRCAVYVPEAFEVIVKRLKEQP